MAEKRVRSGAAAQADETADAKANAVGAADAPPDYETALHELETLVAQMEAGELSLEASLVSYRRGAQLVAYCQQQLETVDRQVRLLDGETLRNLEVTPDTATASGSLEGASVRED